MSNFILVEPALQALWPICQCWLIPKVEGFDFGDAKAERICEVINKYEDDNDYHAQLWMLKDLGFKIISEGPSRIVFKNGKYYEEGTVIKLVLSEKTFDNEGVYVIQLSGTNKYKIGITNNFRKRLQNLKTGNPFPIEIHNFFVTNFHRELEDYLHKQFQSKNIGKEWFELSSTDLIELHNLALNFIITHDDSIKE